MPKEKFDSSAEDAPLERYESASTINDKTSIPAGTFDPVYEAKARVLNKAIQDIGMGWYQWQLFIVVSFGYSSDNAWPIVTSLILPAITNEFGPKYPAILTLSQNIGLLIGAMFWGYGCDIFGRKWSFNLTLGVTSVWGLIAASSPNFAAICTFCALWSFGVGGNLPVDSAVFLEFLPGTHQYLLTVLAIGWALAQVIANLIAWPLLGNLICQEGQEVCRKQDNMGWRYFVITMGGLAMISFFVRFVLFTIYESPKYLMGKGRDEEAVHVVHEVARRNGKTTNLTVDDLKACEPEGYIPVTDARGALKRSLEAFSGEHVRALFTPAKLAISTVLIMTIWGLLGLGYPLYNAFLPALQAGKFNNSMYITYRNSLIIAVLGVPGALLGGLLVETRAGRKGVLGLATALTGVFLYCSTTSKTSNALLGWNCAYNFCSTVMYAVLYGYTPEIFPTLHRGTGNALTATANRIFGIMAPIIYMFADKGTSVPVYISGALFIAAGSICFVLPYESRGTASL